MNESILAVIPARGGSKGVPRKNLAPLGGKSLLTYSIGHALSAKLVTRTVVSTEDAEIAEVARQWGAEVIPRPLELASDTATTESVLLHALSHLEQEEQYVSDLVVLLQPTSPFRQAGAIDQAIELLWQSGADSLLSVYRSHDFYWKQVDGWAQPVNYNYKARPRRQDQEPQYVENGSIYVTRTDILKGEGNRLGGKIAILEMSFLDSIQIDTMEDLLLAEQILLVRQRRQAAEILQGIHLLALDFDGVLTDNRVMVMEDGREAVMCHRGDGLGLSRLKEAGVPVVVISAESNPVVSARCNKLGIPCFQDTRDKLEILKEIAQQHALNLQEVAFVGNDTSDIEPMKAAGVAIAVADAHPEVLAVADLTTVSPGGRGAVREIADLLLAARRRNA
jgi:YrbI family 3-deoxy-D-manno-octulosonate 8-phosphate phosphatase